MEIQTKIDNKCISVDLDYPEGNIQDDFIDIGKGLYLWDPVNRTQITLNNLKINIESYVLVKLFGSQIFLHNPGTDFMYLPNTLEELDHILSDRAIKRVGGIITNGIGSYLCISYTAMKHDKANINTLDNSIVQTINMFGIYTYTRFYSDPTKIKNIPVYCATYMNYESDEVYVVDIITLLAHTTVFGERVNYNQIYTSKVLKEHILKMKDNSRGLRKWLK